MSIVKKTLSRFSILCVIGALSICMSNITLAAQVESGSTQKLSGDTKLVVMGVIIAVCFIGVVYYFWQYRKMRKEVEQLLYFDEVSQLPNKTYITQYVNELDNKGKGYAYTMLAIDDIEELNSLFGHETSGVTYRHLADSLSAEIQENEILCSISSSTFGLLLKIESREAISQRFGQILKKIEETSVRDETSNYFYHCKFYGGIYEITGEETDFDEVFHMCNLAVTKANHKGSFKYQFFDSVMQNELIKKRQLMEDIGDAFEKNEIKPYFQPQYEMDEKTVCGAEMLSRWEHPTHGLIRAADFISLLEVSGKILELDLYIFEEACKQIKKWVESERMPVPIWINIFQHNLYETQFIEKVFALSQSYGVPKNLLGFEIRANLLVPENMEILEIIQSYNEHGFLVCVDRFEPSSPMSILYNYPLDRVKVTSEFIESAKRSASVKKGLENLIRFSKELNISTCGKGVLVKLDEELLKEVECEVVQGDFYGEACDMKKFEEIIF